MSVVESNVFIGLGSNMGDRELNLLRAIAEIGKIPDTKVTSLSSFYETEPIGIDSSDKFINAVVRLETTLSPQKLLERMLDIEAAIFKRVRTGKVASRRMDLDLLLYGDRVINMAPVLLLPHPRLHKRRFVLTPLAEIAPDFIHPVFMKCISELLEEVEDSTAVTTI